MKLIAILFTTSIFVACADGNCRENDMKKNSATEGTTQAVLVASNSTLEKVKVYKYDGSLQCGMGEAVSAEKMKAELKNIKVYSAQNKSDGLMHIQQCGTPTGKANVYEISKNDLAEAKRLGFKEWLFE
jgi:hypothetical protein